MAATCVNERALPRDSGQGGLLAKGLSRHNTEALGDEATLPRREKRTSVSPKQTNACRPFFLTSLSTPPSGRTH